MSEVWYDEAAADHVVEFFSRFLVHTTGRWRGIPFRLEPWQEHDIIRPLFGTKTRNEDGEVVRLYRTAWLEFPSGNGKSELLAGILLYLLIADGEAQPHNFGAAVDREQAGLVFGVAAEMVKLSKRLRKRLKTILSTKRIINPADGGFYVAIPGDPDGADGFVPHGIGFDEVHRQRTRELYDTLAKGLTKRRQPMMVMISTAGVDEESIGWELHEYARQVAEGSLDDPTWFVRIYAAPDGADWRDESVWRACNPAIGTFKSIEGMRAEARKAERSPAALASFCRFQLNWWGLGESKWINVEEWDAGAGVVDEADLKGRPCFGGLDLSSTTDLTAWALWFPDKEDPEAADVIVRAWCPEAKLTDKANRYASNYKAWVRQGWLTPTPGNTIDYAYVRQAILRDAAQFRLVDLNVDRLFQAHQIATELEGEGLKVVGMGQGFFSMSAPTKEFERRVLMHKIRHGGNRVLRWAIDSTQVLQDPAGNLKPDKRNKKGGRIDPVVALIMALERSMRHQPKRSIYEDGGLRSLG